MSVIYRAVKRKSNPLVPTSPDKFYAQIITLGSKVNLKYMAERMRDNSSLTTGDIKSVLQNFVDQLKAQLLEGKTINIDGLGVFSLAARSKGMETAEELTANSIEGVRICFQANKELKLYKDATRASEKLEFVRLEEHLKNMGILESGVASGSAGGQGTGGNNGGDDNLDAGA